MISKVNDILDLMAYTFQAIVDKTEIIFAVLAIANHILAGPLQADDAPFDPSFRSIGRVRVIRDGVKDVHHVVCHHRPNVGNRGCIVYDGLE